MSQNETNRHFELRNLDENMRDAHEAASRVISKKEAAQRAKKSAVGSLLTLLVIAGFVVFLYFQ
ncbi:hypothetical protein DFI02_101851 [Rhizobium sp. PP-F2F-G20b]|nr:hypothetical protein DFI02_101851 [Rhizobium sp. PP-F2F-G20b]